MSSDAEEFDLHQLDHETQSPDSSSGDDGEEHSYTRRRSRKRKHAETALGPLDVYGSLGESEMEEENARKRKNRRLGVNERRELTGYSQLMRTLETDHVQDVGSHIVNFHRSLVMEPLETPDQPLEQMSKEERPPRETGAPRVVTNLKSAWPLQPSVIQTPKFSLVDEVRAIAQRHVETQPNRHPLISTAYENLPGPSDPSGSHPYLPDAAVNALAVRTKVLLDQVLGLLHQYRPATAPSTQLRAPPMNWELVLDILAGHDVVDPAKEALSVIERTKARLEKILGSGKNKKVRNRPGSTGSAEPSLSTKSSDSASPRGYLSYLDDDLAFLDNVQEVQKRSQAKRDAQQLLLKLTRKNLNRSENGTPPASKPSSDEPLQGSRRSESPGNINAENAGLPASPVSHEGERSDFKDDVEPLRASSEDSSLGSGEDDKKNQDEGERATPETVQTGSDGSVERLPPIDDSPPKSINGWAVYIPSEESEESSDEGEGQGGNEIAVTNEVGELEDEAGSKQEDDEGEDESATSSTETSPQTDSDPLFGGDAQSDSDESKSADELSKDDEAEGYYGGEVSANESDRSDSKQEHRRKSPSSASRHRGDSDGEGIEEESELEGVAGKDSDSDSESEGSE
ncbi:hypothetical protein M407DRAFT_22491 [Tulasnella calospora MUT 4182]|uniref:Uncharacterized protein n=1 Tax=Tulasnella calospora MUT 4182 TaxID=1051891 RepID=A0A0C3M3N7_9AGAM|nr:hypothetical protein M407DRAFT_22491 [Tulasnella calospora MUT 4182]